MFTSGVSSTNEAEVDLLMGVKTPGADDLLGGKKQEESKEDAPSPLPSTKLTSTTESTSTPTSSEEDTDLLLGGTESEDDSQETDNNPKLPKPVSKKVEPKKSTIPETMEVDYQAIYQKMVDENIWEEVEVSENTEWSKETFLEIQKLQAEAKYEDLLSRTGSYGKAIIQFEKDGGNPTELLNLFREQKDIRDFDVSIEENQEEFLGAYYASQGYSEKSIERTIRSLRDQGGTVLQEEAEEKKALWNRDYEGEIKARQQEQALAAQESINQQRKFHNVMEDTITKDADVTPKERRELQSYILDYSQNFRGQQVSQFYLDMAEIQKDPANYVELAKFVKGIKNGEYIKKFVDKTRKETSAQSFMKIKNGASLTHNTGNPDLEKKGGSSFVSLLSKNK